MREAADALLITGDVFDSATPPASAERMWFEGFQTVRCLTESVPWGRLSWMERLKALLQSRQIGIDAWYDCYLAEATQLVRELVDAGEQLVCFGLLDELSEDAQVRFFEAVTSVEDLALVPELLAILSRSKPEIAEPIVDGLRSWSLAAEDQEELRRHAVKLRGRSPVLDKIIDTIA